MNRVLDKVAFITGAAAGIGRAAALALAKEGAHVVAADIDLTGAEAVARDIRSCGRRSLALQHDAGDELGWKAAIDATMK
jgi:NAD(P)-dependent dehydrogenase (short-subunit alcohol dehydrogenase family)